MESIGTFWARYQNHYEDSSQGISMALSDPSCTVENLLDIDEFIQELNYRDKPLVTFLSQTKALQTLVALVTEDPPADASPERCYKYPFLATEVFCSGIDSICHVLIQQTSYTHRRIAKKFWRFLKKDRPLNPVLTGYFCRIFQCLLCKWPTRIVRYLRFEPLLVDLLLRHVYSRSIADLLKSLLTYSNVLKEKNQTLKHHKSLFVDGMIAKLLQRLHVAAMYQRSPEDLQKCANISMIIQELLANGPEHEGYYQAVRELSAPWSINCLMECLYGNEPLVIGAAVAIIVDLISSTCLDKALVDEINRTDMFAAYYQEDESPIDSLPMDSHTHSDSPASADPDTLLDSYIKDSFYDDISLGGVIIEETSSLPSKNTSFATHTPYTQDILVNDEFSFAEAMLMPAPVIDIIDSSLVEISGIADPHTTDHCNSNTHANGSPEKPVEMSLSPTDEQKAGDFCSSVVLLGVDTLEKTQRAKPQESETDKNNTEQSLQDTELHDSSSEDSESQDTREDTPQSLIAHMPLHSLEPEDILEDEEATFSLENEPFVNAESAMTASLPDAVSAKPDEVWVQSICSHWGEGSFVEAATASSSSSESTESLQNEVALVDSKCAESLEWANKATVNSWDGVKRVDSAAGGVYVANATDCISSKQSSCLGSCMSLGRGGIGALVGEGGDSVKIPLKEEEEEGGVGGNEGGEKSAEEGEGEPNTKQEGGKSAEEEEDETKKKQEGGKSAEEGEGEPNTKQEGGKSMIYPLSSVDAGVSSIPQDLMSTASSSSSLNAAASPPIGKDYGVSKPNQEGNDLKMNFKLETSQSSTKSSSSKGSTLQLPACKEFSEKKAQDMQKRAREDDARTQEEEQAGCGSEMIPKEDEDVKFKAASNECKVNADNGSRWIADNTDQQDDFENEKGIIDNTSSHIEKLGESQEDRVEGDDVDCEAPVAVQSAKRVVCVGADGGNGAMDDESAGAAEDDGAVEASGAARTAESTESFQHSSYSEDSKEEHGAFERPFIAKESMHHTDSVSLELNARSSLSHADNRREKEDDVEEKAETSQRDTHISVNMNENEEISAENRKNRAISLRKGGLKECKDICEPEDEDSPLSLANNSMEEAQEEELLQISSDNHENLIHPDENLFDNKEEEGEIPFDGDISWLLNDLHMDSSDQHDFDEDDQDERASLYDEKVDMRDEADTVKSLPVKPEWMEEIETGEFVETLICPTLKQLKMHFLGAKLTGSEVWPSANETPKVAVVVSSKIDDACVPTSRGLLELLRLIKAIVCSKPEAVMQYLIDGGIISAIVEVFFSNKWNNSMHLLISYILRAVIIRGQTDLKLLRHLLLSTSFLLNTVKYLRVYQRIRSLDNEALRVKMMSKTIGGYIEHILLICSTIESSRETVPWLKEYLQIVEPWESLIKKEILTFVASARDDIFVLPCTDRPDANNQRLGKSD